MSATRQITNRAAPYFTKPRRVVITAMGVVSPLGTGIQTVWNRLIVGIDVIREQGLVLSMRFISYILELFKNIPSQIGSSNCRSRAKVHITAGQVKYGIENGLFNPSQWLTPHVYKI
jgi:hypothetical protein